MKVLFGTKTVQKMGRVMLGDTLLRNAGLQEGDEVEIYFDAVHKHIVIQKASDSPAQDQAPAGKPAQQRKKR